MTETKPTKKDRFKGLIGQTKAKRKLSFHLDNFDATKILPHMMFIAPKGCGKTMLAKAVGRNLYSAEPTSRTTIDEFGARHTVEVPAGSELFKHQVCTTVRGRITHGAHYEQRSDGLV